METTTPVDATAVVQELLGRDARVLSTRRLHGGMINRVEEWTLDRAPGAVVAKISPNAADAGLHHEHASLAFYRAQTAFPVPRPHACRPAVGGTVLLMERLPGRNLGDAHLTPAGVQRVQIAMARHLAALHTHQSDTYGSAVEAGRVSRWTDWFRPRIESNYRDAFPQLSSRTRQICKRLIADLPAWLPESGRPTLVHSDLWATNILVDDSDPGRPAITGYVDGAALYTDVEYELAYLRVFGTVDEPFFEAYGRPMREGFDRRCRVYWLNTLLMHTWLFGAEFLPRTERLAQEIEQLW